MFSFFDATFVTLLCFILFMIGALGYGYRRSVQALDDQIEHIRETLKIAEAKLENSQERLRNETKIKDHLSEEIERLKDEAQQHLLVIKDQMNKDIAAFIEFRQSTVDQMMQQLRLKTVSDLKETLSDQVQETLKCYLEESLDKKNHEDINDLSIQHLESLVGQSSKKGTRSSSSQAPILAKGA